MEFERSSADLGTARRAVTVADFSRAYDIPAWTVRKMIRQKRIRAINFGTSLRPMYRIPLSEAERLSVVRGL